MMRDGFRKRARSSRLCGVAERFVVVAVSVVGVGAATVGAADGTAEHDYVLHCSGCHRADGTGAPEEVPSLVGIDRFLRSPEGRAYLIRAPGVAQAPVGDQRLANLMNWVVGRFGATHTSPGYTADEVAVWRRDPLRDPTELRARLLAEAANE